ncbi:hypothetical protein QTP88_021353 [Uroleucon formosanum]
MWIGSLLSFLAKALTKFGLKPISWSSFISSSQVTSSGTPLKTILRDCSSGNAKVWKLIFYLVKALYCEQGLCYLPPWIYGASLDEDGRSGVAEHDVDVGLLDQLSSEFIVTDEEVGDLA